MKAFLLIFIFGTLGLGGATVYQGVNTPDSKIGYPLHNGEEREKKLTFGLFVTPDPETNPIDPPERFTGYHTALDLEITSEEEKVDVPVIAACEGKILQAEVIPGYGGIIIQSCRIDNEDVTVLYGHLDYDRFKKGVGEKVKRGEEIGFLGEEKSPESGDTRKHLHFGIHRGTEIEVRGYVEKEEDLDQFIDPASLLPK